MDSDQPKIFALILAGGSGTRFWPLSRNVRPKQLLNLFDEETLIEKAVNRLEGLVPPEQILVLTNEVQREGIIKALPMLPPGNVVAEPARRDTAPAIALAAGWIAARDPNAVMIALPADQLVVKEEAFRQVLEAAAKAASEQSAIVTLGIRPTWACPGYGYIERGAVMNDLELPHGFQANEVVCFREKPSSEVAEEYVANGNFSWNAGIFIWSIATVVRELTEHCPQLAAFIEELRSSADFSATVAEKFEGLEKVSIDYALMENAKRILNIEADVGWDDVGGWPSVAKYLENDENENSHRGPLISVDAARNIVFSVPGAPIPALLGVSDLIVVQTEDALLVADRNDADQIKKLVDVLPEELL